MTSGGQRLILASTSPYRRELLLRLGLSFDIARPEVDETPLPDEPAQAMAERLARAKAEAVLATADDRRAGRRDEGPMRVWTLGSDQVACLDDPSPGQPIGKPGDRAGAIAQLRAMSGRAVRFHTALCLAGPDGARLCATDLTTVRFRALGAEEIARYVDREQPFDCAGSFKSEGLGIALFEAIESNDPTALIGLPLIATARLLRESGFTTP
jgi:septum formation protein